MFDLCTSFQSFAVSDGFVAGGENDRLDGAVVVVRWVIVEHCAGVFCWGGSCVCLVLLFVASNSTMGRESNRASRPP